MRPIELPFWKLEIFSYNGLKLWLSFLSCCWLMAMEIKLLAAKNNGIEIEVCTPDIAARRFSNTAWVTQGLWTKQGLLSLHSVGTTYSCGSGSFLSPWKGNWHTIFLSASFGIGNHCTCNASMGSHAFFHTCVRVVGCVCMFVCVHLQWYQKLNGGLFLPGYQNKTRKMA